MGEACITHREMANGSIVLVGKPCRHYLKEICIKQATVSNCNLVELYLIMWDGFILLRNWPISNMVLKVQAAQ